MLDQGPQVFFVGAGPGNPGLLTIRARECLALADVVIYDRLVTPRVLEYAASSAERIAVADLAGCHPEKAPQIHNLILDAARRGKRVVRLKGGDPLLFARGGEEVEAVRRAGFSYEIVPGVTAGLAAAAFAGIPLTHRLHASAVAFVTGHEDPSKPDSNLDWQALAHFPGTLVIYMGIARLAQLVDVLRRHGKPPSTPAAAIRWGSTGNQQTVQTTLSEIIDAVQRAALKAPAVVVIGSVAGLRQELAWFEQRPLFGKQILVTRPPQQAADFARRLEQLGAVPHIAPVIDIREPSDWGPADTALGNLASYDWLVFTSANGVHAFIHRLGHLGHDLRRLGRTKLAAIGPSTAAALASYYLTADVVPDSFRSESLADALRVEVAGQRVLLVRADRGREVLRDQLSQVARVEQIAVYSQVEVLHRDDDALAIMREGRMEYATLTSSNIARAFIGALDEAGRAQILSGKTKLATISPVTSEAVREMGMPVAGEAKRYTSDGIIEVLLDLAANESH
jgi:uroporphyrinogen III methyltransferase/synthase